MYASSRPPLSPPETLQLHHQGFDLRDMRLFHNFMTASMPHLPLEREEAWLHDIPILAQQHDFLMHGILALGAAHLHAMTNLDLKSVANRHRALAMRGLHSISDKHDSASPNSRDDSSSSGMTAVLAASYLLTFTASYMGDSFDMFLVLVRACSSVTTEIVSKGFPPPLVPANQRPHLKIMQKRLDNAPALPSDEIKRAMQSLIRVKTHCTMFSFQQNILNSMKAVLEYVQEPFEGASLCATSVRIH
jgi:hypothetical protein